MNRVALLLTSCFALAMAACSSEQTPEVGASADAITSEQIVLPVDDPCNAVLRPIAEGVASSTWGSLEAIKYVQVSPVSETDERIYDVFVDGPEFTVDGQEFPNDHHFTVILSNDSSFKCWVQSVQPG
jgi:hypothetical protein